MEEEGAGHRVGTPGSTRPAPEPGEIKEGGEQHNTDCGCETHSHASRSPEDGEVQRVRQPNMMDGGAATGTQVQRVRSSGDRTLVRGQRSARKLYKEASCGVEDMDNVIWTGDEEVDVSPYHPLHKGAPAPEDEEERNEVLLAEVSARCTQHHTHQTWC